MDEVMMWTMNATLILMFVFFILMFVLGIVGVIAYGLRFILEMLSLGMKND